ncbi:MAG: DUF2304 domain-containing protein [Candidatus Eisenbacteria bacterium]
MFTQVQTVSVLGSLLLLLIILEFVRKGRLAEEFSLLWILTAAVLFVLSLWRGVLDLLAGAIGIYYPPSALFLVGFGFVLLLILHFSVVVSRLSRENRELAQQIALLRRELEETSGRGRER